MAIFYDENNFPLKDTLTEEEFNKRQEEYTSNFINSVASNLDNGSTYRYTTTAGCDIIPYIVVDPNVPPIVIGEIQTISYSIRRDKFPIRTVGRTNPKGFAYGQRTIAGSIIFTVFNRNKVYDVMQQLIKSDKYKDYFLSCKDPNQIYYLMDMLPPFNINIIMKNEYGAPTAGLAIEGITITDEGQVMSIEDLLVENTVTYMATDINVLNIL